MKNGAHEGEDGQQRAAAAASERPREHRRLPCDAKRTRLSIPGKLKGSTFRRLCEGREERRCDFFLFLCAGAVPFSNHDGNSPPAAALVLLGYYTRTPGPLLLFFFLCFVCCCIAPYVPWGPCRGFAADAPGLVWEPWRRELVVACGCFFLLLLSAVYVLVVPVCFAYWCARFPSAQKGTNSGVTPGLSEAVAWDGSALGVGPFSDLRPFKTPAICD